MKSCLLWHLVSLENGGTTCLALDAKGKSYDYDVLAVPVPALPNWGPSVLVAAMVALGGLVIRSRA